MERLKHVDRIDVVFDRYDPKSLKTHTRLARGTGQKVLVTPATRIPQQFSNKFLAVNDNKEALFHLLANDLMQDTYDNKIVVCTQNEQVLASSGNLSISDIAPCTHEEADNRIMLHVKHAVANSHTKVTIKTVDSDVVVIALSWYRHISNIKELWIEFGTGKHRRYIPIHKLSEHLTPPIAEALPFFHAFTGCDTVSTFAGIGKRSAWNAWMKYHDVDETFIKLGNHQCSSLIQNKVSDELQRFVCLMYDRTTTTSNVDDCRRILFTKKNQAIQNIPPTLDALIQHTKRAALQAFIWNKCLERAPVIPQSTEFGWKSIQSGFEPVWTTLPDVSSHCEELVSCSCKKRCSICKCVKQNLPCTQLCACEGHCSQKDLQ